MNERQVWIHSWRKDVPLVPTSISIKSFFGITLDATILDNGLLSNWIDICYCFRKSVFKLLNKAVTFPLILHTSYQSRVIFNALYRLIVPKQALRYIQNGSILSCAFLNIWKAH